MIELNDTNGASVLTHKYAAQAMNDFEGELTGAEFGVAYGGGIEHIGKMWKDRGSVYGFDTFEGHPKEIGEVCEFSRASGGRESFAAICMDNWYKPENYGKSRLSYEYQREELDREKLFNVILVKGLVTKDTRLPFEKLHYCLLDLDFPISMFDAYNLVKNIIVQNGFLLLHDVIPKGHIHGCYEYYQQILSEGLFTIIEERPECLLAILKKK